MNIRRKILETALAEYGVTEIPGSEHNKRILQYAEFSGIPEYDRDEIAWCGLAMAYVFTKCDVPIPEKPLLARSWLNVGRETMFPNVGDLAIFWRVSPESWQGHVGLVINMYGEYIHVLGGNQRNQVNISRYKSSELLGYREIVTEYR